MNLDLQFARRSLLTAIAWAAVAAPGLAQTTPPNLSQLSIEDLANIEVTSASRKEQRAVDVAAAVFVITRDDIRRSGMTSVPELLRLAPGVEVAQINGSKWAISVRGFNAVYANKLLVLIDGRTIYSPIFSGVLWDAEDLMLDDIDRIEVIRGPGAATWGANAVNGVINIVTRPTSETHGGLVRVDVGSAGEQAALRYGGMLGLASYRVYAQVTHRDDLLLAPDTPAEDGSHSVTTGFRTDRTTGGDALFFDGSVTAVRGRALWSNLDPATSDRQPISLDISNAIAAHLLGRWTRTAASGASLQIQAFVDVSQRDEPITRYDRQTVDLDTQYHRPIGARQDLVAGVGYRLGRDRLLAGPGFSLTPSAESNSLVTTFVQDEIAFFDRRLALTLGAQLHYNSVVGGGLQPTARLLWKPNPRQRLWAATSHALRTPSRYERGIRVTHPPIATASGLPLVASVLGNVNAETETLVDAEVGYRIEARGGASLDVTAYAGRYGHLQTTEQFPPVFQAEPSPQLQLVSQFSNALDASTRGVEVSGHWAPLSIWQIDGSYTGFHVTPHLSPASLDPNAAMDDGSTPRHQWQLRSSFSPASRFTVAAALFHVGRLRRFEVDAYTRADLTAEWRWTPRLSVMAIGQNLLEPSHFEFSGESSLVLATRVPRSGSLRLRWTF